MIESAKHVMTEIEAWRPRFERGDTELVVSVGPALPTWRDAAGWLKVEAAFAASCGRLAQWVAELPRRLTLGEPA